MVKISKKSINNAEKEILTGYEILMKEYYSKNAFRHSKEAEESLVLANKIEKIK
jgi:hypothetical protein